jgi:hypothetical protein
MGGQSLLMKVYIVTNSSHFDGSWGLLGASSTKELADAKKDKLIKLGYNKDELDIDELEVDKE